MKPHSLSLVAFLSCTWMAGAASPLAAADLVEPWAPGVSSLELAVAGAPGGSRATRTLVGAGLGAHLSLGLSAGAEDEGAEPSYGAVLLYSRSLGRAGDADLWCESGLRSTRDASCGVEWSRDFARATPYARLTMAVREGSGALVPLAGVAVPLGERLGLHVELSLESAAEDVRPLRLAFGPNWALTDRLEVIPEIAWTQGAHGDGEADFGLCLALDISR